MTTPSSALVGSSLLRCGVGFLLLDRTKLITLGQTSAGFHGLMPGSISAPLYNCLRSRRVFHAAFRAAGLRTAKHQLVATANPAEALSFAAESGYPVSVRPPRRRDSPVPLEDLVDQETLSGALNALAQQGVEAAAVEKCPPGDRFRCLLRLGEPLMVVRSPADSGSRAPDSSWEPGEMTRRDRRFLSCAGRALPGLTVLDLDFIRAGRRGDYTVVDATVVPRIERYLAAGRGATRSAVDKIVSHEVGVELPDRATGEITATVTMATDGPTEEEVGTELTRRLEKASVRSGWYSGDNGAVRIVAEGEADGVATACVEVMAVYANDGLRLTIRQ